MEFLEAMIASEHTPHTIVYNTLLELYLQNWAKLSSPSVVSYVVLFMNLLDKDTSALCLISLSE